MCKGLGLCWKINRRFRLEKEMLPSVRQAFPNHSSSYFLTGQILIIHCWNIINYALFYNLQDNCRAHTAHVVQEWIAENDIEVLPWVSEVRILILLQTFGSILKKIIIKISGQGMQKICRDVYKKRKLRYTTDGLLAL